jgi:hypothetical protein
MWAHQYALRDAPFLAPLALDLAVAGLSRFAPDQFTGN